MPKKTKTDSSSVAADQLKSIIERIERLEEEKANIGADIRDVTLTSLRDAIAYVGQDAVLFDDESERVFQDQGLDAFLAREAELAEVPMNPGPFKPFLTALGRVQAAAGADQNVIRTALVTARSAPATKRVVKTLRTWDVRVDESFFLGGVEKAGVLAALNAHIFFDDQSAHLERTSKDVPSVHIPFGVRNEADLLALRELGCAGALVASALHDGRLDRAALDRLAREVRAIVGAPEMSQLLNGRGFEVMNSTPEQFADDFKPEFEVVTRKIRELGIQPQ